MALLETGYHMFEAELPLSVDTAWDSAFLSHGLSTWVVLLGGWTAFCTVISWLGENVPSVKASKLQPYEKSHDAKLVNLAQRTVIRNWVAVLVQTLAFAPVLKQLFPLHQLHSAMSPGEYALFFVVWFVSNDFLFTIAHTAFHEIKWLYKFAHKEHHTWKAPFVWMSHAMSFTELTANGVSVMAYPIFHAVVLGRTTPLELVWFVQLVSQLIGCIEHSGFDALHPLVIINPAWFPSWVFSTTRHHDDHHKHFQGNYGGYLAIWDVLMGTTIPEGASSYKKKVH